MRIGFKCIWLTLGTVALSASASAQPVTFADLNGAAIEESVLYNQVSVTNGQTSSYQSKVDRKISIGPGDRIDDTEIDTRIDSAGTHVGRPRTGSWTIGVPREVHRLGGGHKIWTFSNGTLTLLRAFLVGGYATHISFRRGAAGLTCSVNAPHIHEVGAPGLLTIEDDRGREVQVVSSKQVSSSCQVTKSN